MADRAILRRCWRAPAQSRAPSLSRTNAIPDDLNQAQLRLGMSGSVTVFADNAGVIGLLMSILVWISSYARFCEASMPPLEGKCYPMPSRIEAGARS
jgi:hypothetical protein